MPNLGRSSNAAFANIPPRARCLFGYAANGRTGASWSQRDCSAPFWQRLDANSTTHLIAAASCIASLRKIDNYLARYLQIAKSESLEMQCDSFSSAHYLTS